jgi:RHS repeat-associated protein
MRMNFYIKKWKAKGLPLQKMAFAAMLLVCAHAQAQVNYVRIYEATAPEQNATTLMGKWVSDVKTTTQYVDGLGRPIQTVVKQGSLETSSGVYADLVSPTVYDDYGRETMNYMPFVANNGGGNTSITDGGFKTNALVQQNIFATAQYPGENYFYNKTIVEASPLNRPMESYAPGISWAGSEGNPNPALKRNVQIKYFTNTAIDDVKIWNTRSSLTNPSFQTTIYLNSGTNSQTVFYNWSSITNASAVTRMYRLVGTTVWTSGTAGTTSPAIVTIPTGNYEYAIQIFYNNGTVSDIIINGTNNNTNYYTSTTYNTNSSYPAGELFKTITIDEHKKQIIEFKDKEGKVILKKVQLTAADDIGTGTGYTGWLCTYYLYNEFNAVSCVLQPNAVKQMSDNNVWTLDAPLLAEQAFKYEYDARNRMIKKKVPGAGEVWMVYDANDRLVMTQDANMRSQQKWMYTTYDELNRPVSTGLITDAANYNNLSYHLNAANASTTAYPNVAAYTSEELSTNFYDNYDWLTVPAYANPLTSIYNNSYDTYFQTASNSTWPYAQGNVQSVNIKSLPTGGRTKVLGTANTYLYSIAFYDEKNRAIQSQSTNITGGVDIATTQYTWAGQPLVIVNKQEKQGVNAQTTIDISQITYDDLGRGTKIEKRISNTLVNSGAMDAYKTIVKVAYNKIGQAVDKILAPDYNNGAGLETQKMEYNIRGWLLGMNRAYAKEEPNAPNNYFGFDLGYDKTALLGTQAYNRSQYNGNIAGTEWRSKGDGKKRKYDYSYDAANRLLQADFNQYSAANVFDKTDGIDFTLKMGAGVDALGNEVTPNSAYDANGNILQMQQWALKINASTQIDNLKYTYIAGTNRLKSVTDFFNDATTKLGDFKTNITHPQSAIKSGLNATSPQTSFDNITDYTYDANGSINIDNNKGITSITYNYLNLPQVITITGKGSITYTYDAGGNKIKKEVAENGQPIKTTLYLGGAVFENDVLQFMGHEEGRIRFKPSVLNAAGTVTTPASFVYDYMIKDNLNSTRAVLTDEIKIDRYPTATLEGAIGTATSPVEKEKAYFDINTNYVQQPASLQVSDNYPNDNGTNNSNTFGSPNATSQKMYRTNATTADRKGLGMVLKVMAGDKLNILGKSYYYVNGPVTNNPFNANALIGAFLGTGLTVGGAGNTAVGHGATTGALTGNTSGTYTPINVFTNNNPINPGNNVKAGIAYILFDEQFNYAGGGFDPVNSATGGGIKPHFLQDIAVPKNGYVYIYCSNESNTDVFFDNLEVVHQRSPLLEETHYNAWGSKLLGISTQASNSITNKFNYTGKELQNTEWIDGSGLEEYDYGARHLDPQLGKWMGQDRHADSYYDQSPYCYVMNRPTIATDPTGMDTYLTGTAMLDFFNQLKNGSFKGKNIEQIDNEAQKTNEKHENDVSSGDEELQKNVQNLIGDKKYLDAFRAIAAHYSDINQGLTENKDYWYDDAVVGPGGGFFTNTEKWMIDSHDKHIYVNQTKPTIHLHSNYFDSYLKDPKGMWALLVRAVYHEFVHVRLILGRIGNLGAVGFVNRSNNVNQEITAYYYMFTYESKTLPSLTKEQKINIAYGAVQDGYKYHGVEKPEAGPFSNMYQYILDLANKKK